MATQRFHELFVDYAFKLADDNDTRLSKLEHDIKKLKKIIQNIRIDNDADADIDGSVNTGFGVNVQVDSCPYILLDNRAMVSIDETLNIDEFELCEYCNVLFTMDTIHICASKE